MKRLLTTTSKGNETTTAFCPRYASGRTPENVMEALVHNGPCDVTVENPYHRITEARERSLAVVTLHSEGRSLKAIARFLSVHKSTVHQILKRCAEKRGDGLEERTYPRSQRPAAARLVALPGLWYAA